MALSGNSCAVVFTAYAAHIFSDNITGYYSVAEKDEVHDIPSGRTDEARLFIAVGIATESTRFTSSASVSRGQAIPIEFSLLRTVCDVAHRRCASVEGRGTGCTVSSEHQSPGR